MKNEKVVAHRLITSVSSKDSLKLTLMSSSQILTLVFMLDEGEGEDQDYHLHLKCKLVILVNQTLLFISISLIHMLICMANFLFLSNIESSLSHGARRIISSEA